MDAKARQARLLAHQAELENLFSKNQLMTRLRQEFYYCEEIDFKACFKALGVPVEFGIDMLAQIALHKRCDMQTMVGVLRNHCKSAQEVVDYLQICAEADLIDWNGALQVWVVKFTITQDVQDELDRFQYPLPMVVRPRLVENNRDTGYLLGRGSMILKQNHHDEDICLDHINRVNGIKFSINLNVMQTISNTWRDLDKPKEGESNADYERRKRAFEKYDRTSHDVISLLIHEGNEFYFTHKYDKRGRVYCQGYHVNVQGHSWNKAVLLFAEGEALE